MTISVLLILGLGFMLLEAIVPAFGLFGLGGAFSFIAAIFMLRNVDVFYGVPVDAPLLITLGILGLAVLAGSLYFIFKAWRTTTSAGAEIMIGMPAKVLDWQGQMGHVHVDGETWAAQGPENLAIGDVVTVESRNHLILTVTKDAPQ